MPPRFTPHLAQERHTEAILSGSSYQPSRTRYNATALEVATVNMRWYKTAPVYDLLTF